MEKLYLIDGMSLVFRAYHAMFRSGLTTPDGEPSGAVFGFTNIITSLLEKEKPENIAVVFDTAEPTFRHKMFSEYKANRDEFPEDLVPQLAKIKELLDLLNIKQLEKPGFEADDIIGTLSVKAAEKGMEAICITSDKDFYQLVSDHVKLLKPVTKSSDMELVWYDEVKEKFGVRPDKVIDILALTGDTSDNIPGVKGIGPKTAAPLINDFGNLENLYENIDKVEKDSIRTKLINGKENAFLSKKLVTIKIDVPLDTEVDEFDAGVPDFNKLDAFFAGQGFNRLRRQWREKALKSDFGELLEPVEVGKDDFPGYTDKVLTIEDTKHQYIFVDDDNKLSSLIDEIEEAGLISFDLETSSLDRQTCEIVGISLSIHEDEAFYIPVWNEKSDTGQTRHEFEEDSLFALPQEKKTEPQQEYFYFPLKKVLDKLKPALEKPSIGKCGQNVKFDMYILKRFGIDVHPVVFDSMIASFVLNPERRHNLDDLSKNYLNYNPVPISTLIGEKKSSQLSMSEIDPIKISDYACEDADVALKLRNKMYEELIETGLLKLCEEVEFPLIEVLTQVESNGVAIDLEALKELSVRIGKEVEVLTKIIYKEAGIEFNIDSPKQLGHILFEKMMLPVVKKTKTGYSTDVQVLTQLAPAYPIAEYMLQYRQLVKLKSTYIDALPKLVNKNTGRIHTNFNQAVASTGRLSSQDPNLQNIPIRTALGKEVRKAFIPQTGDAVILSADYSQIELRIMAYICQDENLISAFEHGKDIHAATASLLFDKPLEEVDQDMRRVAKTVNFGIMYGLGSFGLSQRLGLTRTESKEIIDNYFEKYPGIRKYIDDTIDSSRNKGYAETLLGRRRYFRDINSRNANLRRAAERAAINMPIQGTASDMMKIAMINIDKSLRDGKFRSKMMLQVHDELVFEAYKDEIDSLAKLVVDKMRNALPIGRVPVEVDYGTGPNWFEAH